MLRAAAQPHAMCLVSVAVRSYRHPPPRKRREQSMASTISVDLIEASKRSEAFPRDWPIEKVHRARTRYEKFLLLAAKHQGVPVAPTRDIDEMWHLHMLAPRAYFEDCQ